MDNQEGIWVNQSLPTPHGNVVVSIRLDTAIDPGEMLNRLDKESEELWKRMDKVLLKLSNVNDKTPQKITDAINKELWEIHNLQTHNMNEWWRWIEVWNPKV